MGVHQESCKERKIAIILKLVRMNFFLSEEGGSVRMGTSQQTHNTVLILPLILQLTPPKCTQNHRERWPLFKLAVTGDGIFESRPQECSRIGGKETII
jgi:hypothetical protein